MWRLYGYSIEHADPLLMTERLLLKCGTLSLDPEYIAFLESLNAEPTDADKEMKLTESEMC